MQRVSEIERSYAVHVYSRLSLDKILRRYMRERLLSRLDEGGRRKQVDAMPFRLLLHAMIR